MTTADEIPDGWEMEVHYPKSAVSPTRQARYLLRYTPLNLMGVGATTQEALEAISLQFANDDGAQRTELKNGNKFQTGHDYFSALGLE